MAHVRNGPHFNIGAGGYKTCLCDCTLCITPATSQCLCEECGCNDNTQPLRNHAPYPFKAKDKHLCEICGAAIIRTKNRGRWPKRCGKCRGKK